MLRWIGLLIFSANIANAGEPVKIMPLGDSLTEGGYSLDGSWYLSGGYRHYLKKMISDRGWRIDFVGSRSSGPVPENDIQHEGYSGWRIEEVHSKVKVALETFKPDVVLVMLGSNDLHQNFHTWGAPKRLANLVNEILNLNPKVIVLLASPTSTNNPIYNQRHFFFHYALKSYVNLRLSSRLKFVDMFWGADLKLADFTDGVHPTPHGFEKMATVWNQALVSHPGVLEKLQSSRRR